MSSEHPSPPQPLTSQTRWGSPQNSHFHGLIIHHTDQNSSYVLNESCLHFSVNFKKVEIESVVMLTESESHSVLSDSLQPLDYTVHGILQARILEWIAFPFYRGSSQLRDWTQVFCIAGRFFTSWATREAKNTGVGSLSLLHVDLPDPGIELGSPALQEDPLSTELSGKPLC